MFRHWLQCLTLAVVAALLLNSQCYALCAISACQVSNARSSHCQHHHSEKGNPSEQACHYQHPQFFGPQDNPDVTKFAALQFSGALAVPVVVATAIFEVRPVAGIVKRSGHAEHSGIRVLALLSTFRI
jgi:hypothetical protein